MKMSSLFRRWMLPCVMLIGALITSLSYGVPVTKRTYSPYVGRHFATTVYWGNTHLHTSYSLDANLFGLTRLDPAAAFRFARGDTVTATNGMRVKLRRPLDFLVVSDHSEYLGLMPRLDAGDPRLLRTELGKQWKALRDAGKENQVMMQWMKLSSEPQKAKQAFGSEKFVHSVWSEYASIADRYNNPGKFTAFIGYEWTSMPNGNNLHRNVVYEGDAKRASQMVPFSALDSQKPEDLWRWMADYEKKTGGHVLAIPHNPNMSHGLMFRPEDSNGQPFTRQYATTRARWEPLLEITQIKGDSETHPYVSPDDEFANFGRWDTNLDPAQRKPHEDAMYQYEYARPALELGLKLEQKLGVNPFKFGFVGGTDAHTALSTVDEANFWGTGPSGEPHRRRYNEGLGGDKPHGTAFENAYRSWQQLPGGYTAVWATANTRKALFEAMQRKETYATTGARITVRFFGGWDYKPVDAARPDLAQIGYNEGVPMGGDLTEAPKGRVPTFLIRAVKDPVGANLDRAQVIKGWLDEDGKLHEKVYDVVVSGSRTIGADGKTHQKVGDTVDIANASYTNTIGAPELATVWTDPHFDPKQRAFYYLRVLEIPTPRWPAYDAKFYHEKLPKDVWARAQQRAYTSPIWYTPAR